MESRGTSQYNLRRIWTFGSIALVAIESGGYPFFGKIEALDRLRCIAVRDGAEAYICGVKPEKLRCSYWVVESALIRFARAL